MISWLAALLIAQAGPVIEHSSPPFKLRLPAGYDRKVEQLPSGGILAYRRAQPVEEKYFPAVSVEVLGGLIGEEPPTEQTLDSLRQRMMPGARVEARREAWAGRTINVIELYWVQEGRLMMSIAAQVPLRPSAIQVNFFAPMSYEVALRSDLRALLDSLEGDSNIPSRAERFLAWAGIVTGVGIALVGALLVGRRLRKA